MTNRRRKRSRRHGNAKRAPTAGPLTPTEEALPLRRQPLRQSSPRRRASLVSRLGPCISIVEAIALFAAVLGLLATLGESFDGAPL